MEIMIQISNFIVTKWPLLLMAALVFLLLGVAVASLCRRGR
jgi:hypothetical protein